MKGREREIPWQFSGYDSALSLLRVWVPSLAEELKFHKWQWGGGAGGGGGVTVQWEVQGGQGGIRQSMPSKCLELVTYRKLSEAFSILM